jgi:hypothetical protein
MTIKKGMTRSAAVVIALATACLGTSVRAQEGHPLTGTWAGDCGAQRSHVTIVMAWDGKAVTGTINPGPDAVPIGSVALDVANWTVRIEADGKDASGKPAHITAEGRIEDLGSYHRRIVGSWTQGTAKGDCRLTRD